MQLSEALEAWRFCRGVNTMSKKYRSEAMAAIHETIEALHDVGAIEKQTMRRFDEACLTPIRPLKPEDQGNPTSSSERRLAFTGKYLIDDQPR